MGADLIGYMVRGPVQFSAAAVKRAEGAAHKARALANAVLAHLDRREKLPVGPTGLEREVGAAFDKGEVLSAFFPWLADEYETVAEARAEIVALAEATAETEVATFVAWWREGARDTVSRVFGAKQVVFCGDMSWGEEPEGAGYETFKRASRFGITAALGVE